MDGPVDGFSIQVDQRVAVLTIDRPRKRNALTDEMWRALPRVLDTLESDDDVNVVIFRGAGDEAFSAGADIDEYRAGAGNVEWGQTSSTNVARALNAIREFPKATIAAIQGHCVGGGIGIAISCDIRIAGEGARFAIPPARLGLVFPYADTKRLVDLCGPARAKVLLFTGQAIGSDRAYEWGLVDDVFPAPTLFANATALANEIAIVSRYSVRAMKRTIALVEAGHLDEPDEARTLIEGALRGPDHAEGVTAFIEGRPPRFSH